MEKESNGISGTLIGFNTFNLAKETYKQNWVKATVGLQSTFNVGEFYLNTKFNFKEFRPPILDRS